MSVDGTVTTRLTSPWGLAFLPDGSALVSERDTGLVKRVPASGGTAVTVGRVRGSVPQGEGGLLGLAVPPGPDPAFVFAYYTGAKDNRVVRIAWDGSRLGRQTPILTGIPKNTYHDGGRLLVGPDSTLFVGTGDAGQPGLAQDRASLAGKVLRITFDGQPAPGNPFPGSPVYTLGHRNVQGLAFDSAGRLWATEFGEKDVDELNLLRPGRNYGWPVHEGAAKDRPLRQSRGAVVADLDGLPERHRHPRRRRLRGQPARRGPVAGAAGRHPGAHADRDPDRGPRPAAHRRRGARRLALARDEQHRRARQPAREGRPDPPAPRPMTRAATVRTGVLAVALVVALGVLAWALRSGSPSSTFDAAAAPEPAEATATPPDVRVVETIASGLTSPWGLAFLPDGSALVSERDTGQIARIPAGGGTPVPLGTVDGSVPSGEGGLLGLAVPPGPEPSFVLAYTTTEQDNRVVRIEWDGERLGRQTPILTGIPKNTYHDGGRLLTMADGTFVVGTGDAGAPDLAQDPASLAGKVLRITADGAPAPGNPDPGSPVLTLGHRNVQGLALDSAGRLWASEFGQNDADELNLLRPGGELRLARPRGRRRRRPLRGPGGPVVADLDGLPQRHRHPRRRRLRREPARRGPVAGAAGG